jgi:hypothetical protein
MSDLFDTSRYDDDDMPTTSRYSGAEEAKDLALKVADALTSIHSILKDLQAELASAEHKKFHGRNMAIIWEVARWLDPGLYEQGE